MVNLSRTQRFIKRVPVLEFPIKLEIGCGDEASRKEGYVGLDILDLGQEIVWNAEEGIPLPDNSCSEIFSNHTFEHFEDPVAVFNECHRILKPKGTLFVIVPYYKQEKAFALHHSRLWSIETFKSLNWGDFEEHYGCKRWEILELGTNERPDLYCKMTPIK